MEYKQSIRKNFDNNNSTLFYEKSRVKLRLQEVVKSESMIKTLPWMFYFILLKREIFIRLKIKLVVSHNFQNIYVRWRIRYTLTITDQIILKLLDKFQNFQKNSQTILQTNQIVSQNGNLFSKSARLIQVLGKFSCFVYFSIFLVFLGLSRFYIYEK